MATETKFTPGPWHYSGLGEVMQRDEREFICNTKWDGFEGLNEVRNARWEPNAHLIAAAPDLYAALVGCAQVLRESAKQFRALEDHPGHAGIADNLATLAEAALARARGEA